jgi:DNA repair exonuclease SbcCD ATPase subunit
VLLQIALHARLANIRKEAAQRIEDAELLEQVQRASRGRDKAVHRISRDKLNSLRDQARLEAEAELRRQQLLSQLHQLAITEDTQFLQARAQALYQEWQQLADTREDEQNAFIQLKQNIDQRLARQAALDAEIARRREQQQAREDQARQLLARLEGFRDQSAEQLAEPLSAELNELESQWQPLAEHLSKSLQQQWQGLMARAKALSAAQLRLHTHEDEINALLEQQDQPVAQRLRKARQLIERLAWPTDEPGPAHLQQLQHLISQLSRQQAELSSAARQQENELGQQLDQLEHSTGKPLPTAACPPDRTARLARLCCRRQERIPVRADGSADRC